MKARGYLKDTYYNQFPNKQPIEGDGRLILTSSGMDALIDSGKCRYEDEEVVAFIKRCLDPVETPVPENKQDILK